MKEYNASEVFTDTKMGGEEDGTGGLSLLGHETIVVF